MKTIEERVRLSRTFTVPWWRVDASVYACARRPPPDGHEFDEVAWDEWYGEAIKLTYGDFDPPASELAVDAANEYEAHLAIEASLRAIVPYLAGQYARHAEEALDHLDKTRMRTDG